jgi:hypothetical protein
MGEPVQQHLMQLKKYEELCRDEKLVFCSRNDSTTLFLILYKRWLTSKERIDFIYCVEIGPVRKIAEILLSGQ